MNEVMMHGRQVQRMNNRLSNHCKKKQKGVATIGKMGDNWLLKNSLSDCVYQGASGLV
jgi:hypothetical protein